MTRRESLQSIALVAASLFLTPVVASEVVEQEPVIGTDAERHEDYVLRIAQTAESVREEYERAFLQSAMPMRENNSWRPRNSISWSGLAQEGIS